MYQIIEKYLLQTAEVLKYLMWKTLDLVLQSLKQTIDNMITMNNDI